MPGMLQPWQETCVWGWGGRFVQDTGICCRMHVRAWQQIPYTANFSSVGHFCTMIQIASQRKNRAGCLKIKQTGHKSNLPLLYSLLWVNITGKPTRAGWGRGITSALHLFQHRTATWAKCKHSNHKYLWNLNMSLSDAEVINLRKRSAGLTASAWTVCWGADWTLVSKHWKACTRIRVAPGKVGCVFFVLFCIFTGAG